MHFMLEQYPKLFHKRYIHVMTFFLVIYLFSGLMTMNKLSTKKKYYFEVFYRSLLIKLY